jgi:V/A-type H+/Na+-transporting ATPase subunit B
MDLGHLYVEESKAINQAKGSLIIADSIPGIKYDEIVDVVLANGEVRRGKAIDISKKATIVQVYGGASEIDLKNSTIRCKGESLKLPVAPDMLGRIFNGMGDPIDGRPPVIAEEFMDTNGELVNPASRQPPSEFIETGISAIDGLNSLVRGQKLPIFSASGLPHNEITAQIIRQAKVRGKEEKFAIVLGAIGVSYDDASFFMRNLEETGAHERTVAFINTASDPVIERISTPRMALTAAEYLAWKLGIHVLVIITDITNYCEALRELSAMREEIPGRRGYPGYMYTDLATMYERAGRVIGLDGSVTVMPILTMPDDDITHPIADLTGYITEGQIVLSRSLQRKNIYPPIDVFLSLSRMMKEGIGEGKTRADHNNVFMQLYAAYAEGSQLRDISAIMGVETLSDRDKMYLSIADWFENNYIQQGERERRTIENTLKISWEMFSLLPEQDLKLISEKYIKKYLPKYAQEAEK